MIATATILPFPLNPSSAARKAREAELKSRAQSLLMGKLGSLVKSKPPLPPSASVAKPPLPPVTKPPRPPVTAVTKTPKDPLRPTPPSASTTRRDSDEGRRGAPVIRPYLVKKGEQGEEKGGSEAEKCELHADFHCSSACSQL